MSVLFHCVSVINGLKRKIKKLKKKNNNVKTCLSTGKKVLKMKTIIFIYHEKVFILFPAELKF